MSTEQTPRPVNTIDALDRIVAYIVAEEEAGQFAADDIRIGFAAAALHVLNREEVIFDDVSCEAYVDLGCSTRWGHVTEHADTRAREALALDADAYGWWADADRTVAEMVEQVRGLRA